MWADGGYYSRIFLNIAGREPRRDRRSPTEVEPLLDELIAKLEALGDEQGTSDRHPRVPARATSTTWPTTSPPDLIVYFGNLTWRSIGSVGDGRIHVRENDTGPDDANHAKNGIADHDRPGHARSASGRRRRCTTSRPRC